MKVSSIVLSAILFASVQQANASVSSSPAALAEVMPRIITKDLALTKSVDARCQKTYAGYDFLQTADLDFSVSEETYETRPMWPLICSLSENAVKTTITKEEYGVTVTYVLPNGTTTRYDFVSTDENAFEIGAFENNLMNNYNSQKALLDTLTALHNQVMGN